MSTHPDQIETLYPEHAKLDAVKAQSQAIGEFIDFGGYTLCKRMYRAPFNGVGALIDEPTHDDQDGRLVPVGKPINELLAEWFDIDLNEIEKEKRQMLDALRESAR